MKRLAFLTIAVGIAVYAVSASAQPTNMSAPSVAPKAAPVAAMVAPKVTAPVMAPVTATQPAPAAPAPVMAPEPAMAATTTPVAQPVAPSASPEPAKVTPKVSGWDSADKWVSRITSLMLALLTVIGIILGWTKQKDWRQKLKTERWQKIMGYVDDAFPVVESLAKATAWKGDDKLVEFMKRINDWLKGEGDAELSPDEVLILKREAADKSAAAKTESGAKDEVDPKAVTRG